MPSYRTSKVRGTRLKGKIRRTNFLRASIAVTLLAAIRSPYHRPTRIEPRKTLAPIQGPSQKDPRTSHPSVREILNKLPPGFEPNVGQAGLRIDPKVKFFARGQGSDLFLMANGAVLALRKGPQRQSPGALRRPPISTPRLRCEGATGLRMRLANANPQPRISGIDALPGRRHYFFGNDSKMWRTGVRAYRKVRYENIYPGIDLIYYGSGSQFEFDFVVRPGADPGVIKLNFAEFPGETRAGDGSPETREEAAAWNGSPLIERSGDLLIHMPGGEIRLRKPLVYQLDSANHASFSRPINGHYGLTNNKQVTFEVETYDPDKLLVIDPAVSYSTYLGGSDFDLASGIAVDSFGNAYVTGYTRSINFPTTQGALSTAYGGGALYGDAFVAKLNAAGTGLIYSTYLGGSDEDVGTGVSVDGSGNAFVTGHTRSPDFPTTTGAFQASPGGGTCGQAPSTFPCGDAFAIKLSADGSRLVYSTLLGGRQDDWGLGIASDSAGSAYVAGATESIDFPTTPASFEPAYGGGICGGASCVTGFVTKLSADGSTLGYSTYLGGSADVARAIRVDILGNAYVTGSSGSSSFPTTPGAFQTVATPNGDAFVAKLRPDGSGLVYSTYLGGVGDDAGTALAVDSAGNATVTGLTGSADFPTTPGAFQTSCDGCVNNFHDAFATSLNSTGSALIYSTLLGGTGEDAGYGVAVDLVGNAYVAGRTLSQDFPVSSPLQAANAGQSDAFLAELDPTGSALIFSTYLGGRENDAGYALALDASGKAYLAGATNSGDFMATAGALEETASGAWDAFVCKIDSAGDGPPFILTSSNSSAVVVRGANSVGFTLSASSRTGFTGNISLACSNVAPAACAFTPGSIVPGESASLTVSNLVEATANSLNFQVAGTSGSDSVVLPLAVRLADFSLSLSPAESSLAAGQSATAALTVTPIEGFDHSLSLVCSGTPPGATCLVSPSPLPLNGNNPSNATLTIATAARPSGQNSLKPPPQPPLPARLILLMYALLLASILANRHRRMLTTKFPEREARRGIWASVLTGLAACLLATFVACGGGTGAKRVSEPPSGTPSGTYTLTFSGSYSGDSGSIPLTHSIAFMLTVR